MIEEKVKKFMNVMNDIEYGFKDKKGNNIIDTNLQKWENKFHYFYYLQTPEELLKTKCGVCWDQVELERYLFINENISVETFFIYILDGDKLPSHTFLTYEDNNKYYWFEHSWTKYRGIHEYNSKLNLLLDVIEKFKDEHNKVNKGAVLYLYKYKKPKEHIKCNEFYKYIQTQHKITSILLSVKEICLDM